MIKLELYLKEVKRFLNSLVIKNNYFADEMLLSMVNADYQKYLYINSGLMESGRVWIQKFNPYYIFLLGNYIEKTGNTTIYNTLLEDSAVPMTIKNSDLYTDKAFLTRMTVIPVESDSDETITIDKSTFFTYNANGYLIPKSKYYKTLTTLRNQDDLYESVCERYPDQVFLLNAIIWPLEAQIITTGSEYITTDFLNLIKADNYTLLNYDLSFLEAQEQQSILTRLNKTLQYLGTRWDIKEYTYETYYADLQWAMLWYYLNLVIVEQRYLNIKTAAVHSYHIQEYLRSKGLEEYLVYLSHDQQVWLYRNIDYLIAHRGKESTLLRLADNLLPDSTSLVTNTLVERVQESLNFIQQPEYIQEPFGVSQPVFNSFYRGSESPNSLFTRVYNSGYEANNDALTRNKQYNKTRYSKYTNLSTKLVEIQDNTTSSIYLDYFSRVMLDNIISLVFNQQLNYTVTLCDQLQTYAVGVSVNQILPIMLYCNERMHYSHNEVMTHQLPSKLCLNNTLGTKLRFTVSQNSSTIDIFYNCTDVVKFFRDNGYTDCNEALIMNWVLRDINHYDGNNVPDNNELYFYTLDNNYFDVTLTDLPEYLIYNRIDNNFNVIKKDLISTHEYGRFALISQRKTLGTDQLVTVPVIDPNFIGSSATETQYYLEGIWENIFTLFKLRTSIDNSNLQSLIQYLEQLIFQSRSLNLNYNTTYERLDIVGTKSISELFNTLAKLSKDQITEVFDMLLQSIGKINDMTSNTRPNLDSAFYRAMRKLFRSMCSYNITIIEDTGNVVTCTESSKEQIYFDHEISISSRSQLCDQTTQRTLTESIISNI